MDSPHKRDNNAKTSPCQDVIRSGRLRGLSGSLCVSEASQIANFMGPTRGPPGSCRPQMGPMLSPWTLQSGLLSARTMGRYPWQNYFNNFWRNMFETMIFNPPSVMRGLIWIRSSFKIVWFSLRFPCNSQKYSLTQFPNILKFNVQIRLLFPIN